MLPRFNKLIVILSLLAVSYGISALAETQKSLKWGLVIDDQVQLMSEPSFDGEKVKWADTLLKRNNSQKVERFVQLSAGDRVGLLPNKSNTKEVAWQHVLASQYCDSNKLCEGWIPSKSVAVLKQFTRIKQWKWAKTIEIEQGDYAGKYTFNPSGKFEHHWSGGTDGSPESGIDKGHVYQFRNVLWAIDKSENGDVFVDVNGQLCWHEDLTICASR